MLPVDFLAAAHWPHPGKMGMTRAPGRVADLAVDLRTLREVHGAHTLLCLLEDHELDTLGIAAIGDEAQATGLTLLRYPIRDGLVPRAIEDVIALAARLADDTKQGRNVVVHCRAGMGRTGTIVACCLVARGMEADDAIMAVRDARPGTVENGMQESWIRAFGRAVRP